MKVKQENKIFTPIVITLETREEALMFWDLLNHCSSKRQGKLKQFAIELSNWFSNSGQL